MTVSYVALKRRIFPIITCATDIQEPVVILIFFITTNTPLIFLIPKTDLTAYIYLNIYYNINIQNT